MFHRDWFRSTIVCSQGLTADHDLFELFNITRSKEQLQPLLISSSLSEALYDMLLIDTFGNRHDVLQGSYGEISGRGHCGLLRVGGINIQKPDWYHTARLHCCVPGCLAEYEYRVYAYPQDKEPNLERRGLLLAKPVTYTDDNEMQSHYVFGFFDEHRHIDVLLSDIPLPLRARYQQIVNEIKHFPPTPVELTNQVLKGIEPIADMVIDQLLKLSRQSIEIYGKRDQSYEHSHEIADSVTPEGITTTTRRVPLSRDITNYCKDRYLKYIPDLFVLYCWECKSYVTSDIDKHFHHCKFSSANPKNVQLAKESLILMDFIHQNTASNKLPCLPVHAGIACSTCNECEFLEHILFSHVETMHNGVGRLEPTRFQTPTGLSYGFQGSVRIVNPFSLIADDFHEQVCEIIRVEYQSSNYSEPAVV